MRTAVFVFAAATSLGFVLNRWARRVDAIAKHLVDQDHQCACGQPVALEGAECKECERRFGTCQYCEYWPVRNPVDPCNYCLAVLDAELDDMEVWK